MDQFPSGSAPIELDKEFCVKNIPAHFVDWDLFHVFRRFGTVHNVKIPSKQLQSNTKYGFVIMESMNGADEVRSQLRNGKYLSVDNGLQLLVTGVRHGESQRSREEARGENNRPPLKELRGDGMMVKGRCGDRLAPQKSQRSYTAVKCFSQDLPLQTPTKVRVVESPFPCKSISEGFVFHAIPIDQKLGDEYSCLQREMNKFCSRNPNVNEIPKVGQYVLYCRDTIAFRALCNSDTTLYLIDVGEVLPIIRSHIWELIPSFTVLPSLVIPCGIFGISWNKPTTSTFTSCRNALKQWSKGCPSGLIAIAQEYSGLINMVNVQVTTDKGVEENFASSIAQRGLCTCLSHDMRVYSREDLLEAKNAKASDSSPKIAFNENVAEIIVGLQTVAVA